MGVLVTDPFTESSDTELSAHTPNTNGTGWTERLNTTTSTTIDINATTDRIVPSGTSTDEHIVYTAQPDPTDADVDVEITIPSSPSGGTDGPVGLIARYQSATSMYSAGTYPGGNTQDKGIWLIDGAIPGTQIAGGDNGFTNGDILKFELRGSTLKLYQDTGGGYSEVLSVTDSTITAAGEAGLFFGNVTDITSSERLRSAWNMDDFVLTEFAAAGGVDSNARFNALRNTRFG